MLDLNFAVILQVVIAALLVGVGRTVYQTSVNVATLSQKLDDHTAQDERNFAELKKLGKRSTRRK